MKKFLKEAREAKLRFDHFDNRAALGLSTVEKHIGAVMGADCR